jgi:hypothetical protein
VVIGAAALICVSAFALHGSPLVGAFTDAGGTASGLRRTLGSAAGAFFALVLLNASLIGAAALTLSTSYAFGDMFGTKSSLHRSFRDARGFYAMFAGLVAGAAAIVLIPGAPLGVITTSVQALAGVLLPSATVFLLLLCNDRAVLGPWRNPPWLNVLATVIVAVLVLLSLILMATTVFPKINVTELTAVGAAALAVGLAVFGAWRRARDGDRRGAERAEGAVDDAAADVPRAGGVVERAQGSDARAARLPRHLRRAADRQGRPARRRLVSGVQASRIPSSRSSWASIGVGAPLSGSEPLAVLGNAITSRIDSRPAMIATMRSMPKAMPPCGGAP